MNKYSTHNYRLNVNYWLLYCLNVDIILLLFIKRTPSNLRLRTSPVRVRKICYPARLFRWLSQSSRLEVLLGLLKSHKVS